MKLSKTGIKVLTAQYRAVLKKCLLINLGIIFCATGALAETISLDGVEHTINGNTDAKYKFGGFKIDLHNSKLPNGKTIDTNKNIDGIAGDLKSIIDVGYAYAGSKPAPVSKVELNKTTLNLESARVIIDPAQNSTNEDGSIDAIFVKDSTINMINSSLDASTDEGDKKFNTVFDHATLKLVNSELPIDGAVSFTNGSTLSISSPDYFSEEEIIAMFQDDANAKKIAAAIEGSSVDQNSSLFIPSVKLEYTNSDGTKGIIDSDDMQVEQMVELKRLTIDGSKFILGDSENPNDRARVNSDSQIYIKNGSEVTLKNRAVMTFDNSEADGKNVYGNAELLVDNSKITLEDNSQLNVTNGGNAKTIIKNYSQITMSDSSQMNLDTVEMENSKIIMQDDAKLNVTDVKLKNSSILGLGNKVFFYGQVDFSGFFDPATAEVDGDLTRNGYDDEITYNLNSGTLKYKDDKYLYDSSMHTHKVGEAGRNQDLNSAEYNTFADGKYALNSINLNGGTLDIANGKASEIKLAKLALNNESNIALDADLANKTMDRFSGDTVVEGTAKLNIAKLNLVSDATEKETTINFTKNEKLLAATNYTGASSGLKALSPVYSYDVAYDQTSGDFTFTRGGYNPAVYAPSVVGHTVDFLQYNIANTAFNSLASKETVAKEGMASGDISKANNAWVSVIGFDDSVDFDNFQTVDSEMMSVIGGVTSDVQQTALGKTTYGIYAGYMNGELEYDGNKINQEGGYLGLGTRIENDNIIAQSVINGGFIGNEDKHSFGTDKFDTYWAGIALKGGYNYKLNNGVTVQPNLYAGYTFVNNEDYTSTSGAKIKNDKLHLFEVAPGLKVSKDFENGWNTFAQVKYAFVMDNGGDIKIDNVALPNISTDDYVEYGVGVNKELNDSWNMSVSANRRDGGREGWNGNISFKYNF